MAEEKKIEDSVVAWANGLTRADLVVIERGDRFYYPETIKRRNPKTGAIEEKPVLVRVPAAEERFDARYEALEFIRKRIKAERPFGLELAKTSVGVDHVSEVEAVHILSKSIFRVEPPHDPWMLPEFLYKMPMAHLVEIQARIDFYARLEDPRVKAVSEENFWTIVEAVKRVGHLGPFVALAGSELDSFLLTTVCRLADSRTTKSSSDSSTT